MVVNKKQILNILGFFGILLLLSFIRALATYMFIVPNAFAPGGVSGIASIIYNLVGKYNPMLAESWFNPAVTVFIINVPLIIWAVKALDKNFAINTAFCVVFYAVFMGLFSVVKFPVFEASSGESSIMLLASLAGGAISGISFGLMLRMNSSVGGTDILGKIIYKKNPSFDVPWIIFLCDVVVVVASGALGIFSIKNSSSTNQAMVAILSPVFYSFITMFTSSKIAEVFQAGLESSLIFNIITNRPEEIGNRIIKELGRGVTVIKAEGFYTHEERDLLVCVVHKKQINTMKKILKEIDPESFVYVNNAREVTGRGFKL